MAEAKIAMLVTVELDLTQDEAHYLASAMKAVPKVETVRECEIREGLYKVLHDLRPIGEMR